MILTIIICSITALLVFLAVIFKPEIKIKNVTIGTYWIVSLIGAIVLICSTLLPFDYALEKLVADTAINPLKILALFISMTFLSVFLDELGFFKFLANFALKRKFKNQIGLFLVLYLMIAVLTIFTSNDIIILTFTPFICCFAKNAKINPFPYLFGEFFAANTWSMFFIIGNPTNIYLATSAGIDFMSYLKTMLVPTIGGGITSLFVVLLLFYKDLKKPITNQEVEEVVLDKGQVIIGVVHLIICISLLAGSSYLNVEMWMITVSLCASLIICDLIYKLCKKESEMVLVKSFKRLPFSLIPFVLSMFIIVLSLEYVGVTDNLAEMFNNFNTVYSVGIGSFLTANVINNIPMSVLFSSILHSTNFDNINYLRGIYAAIIGSNLGAYFTPVGALAGIMWMSILKRFHLKFKFKDFVKYGSLASIPTLLVSLSLLQLFI